MKRKQIPFLTVLVFVLLFLTGLSALAAEKNFAYPKAVSKKGLYVSPGMEEDAIELGVKHATINLSVGDFMPAKVYRNSTHCIQFDYEGSTYWFAKNAVAQYDQELSRLAKGNVIVTAILLLPKRSGDLEELIYPDARSGNANYYQWNMEDEAAVRTLRAIVTFFQRRYSSRSGKRICGWIVGNEINNSGTWNWAGKIDIDKYVSLYASEVAEVYKAARSVYANARIYMCLDHYWSAGNGRYWYSGKTILDKFASCMSGLGFGNGTWNIAYHAYNVSEHVVDIMSESPSVTGETSTRIITMKNLSVFTDYVKEHFTKNCRIILSEQGYSSVTDGKKTAARQAKSIALAYYIAQNNNMVDSLILHRQVDNTGENEKYGLYTSWAGWGAEYAGKKKISWAAYKYADTTKKNKYTTAAAKKAKKLLGEDVEKTVQVTTGKLKKAKSEKWKKYYTNKFKPFGAYAAFEQGKRSYTIRRDTSRNINVPWGFIRKGTVNCGSRTKLGFTVVINTNGETSSNALLIMRLWSGNRNYYEAQTKVNCGSETAASTKHIYYVDLKNWKYRRKITRIDLIFYRTNGGWRDAAAIQIRNLGTK